MKRAGHIGEDVLNGIGQIRPLKFTEAEEAVHRAAVGIGSSDRASEKGQKALKGLAELILVESRAKERLIDSARERLELRGDTSSAAVK